MASQTRATPGVYASERSSRLDSATVGAIAILPCLCRSKTGSAARAGSSSKLKKDTGTPNARIGNVGVPADLGASLRRPTCDAGVTRDHDRKTSVAVVTGD